MAGDWIKMRVWLRRDPKVIWMANYLARQRAFVSWLTAPAGKGCDGNAHDSVTRNVTQALCVTALLEFWGTAREQGRRIGDDLVIAKCDLQVIDEITDIPCFGEAMAEVGWAVEQHDSSLVLPNYFKDKELPSDRHQEKNKIRQQRFRDRHKAMSANLPSDSNDRNVTLCNVTRNGREEKRREELNTTPQTPLSEKIPDPKPEPQKPAKSPKPKAEMPAIPQSLDTPEFRSAWGEWQQHRREKRHPITPTTAAKQFRDLEKIGVARAVAAIDHSIAKGYQGIYESHANGFAPRAAPPPPDRTIGKSQLPPPPNPEEIVQFPNFRERIRTGVATNGTAAIG